jgi:hypothetical protein
MSRSRSGSSSVRLNGAVAMGGAWISFTPLMQKHLTAKARAMIERSLVYFPELQGRTITIGFTRAHLGSAVMSPPRAREVRLIIRLKVRKLTYQTIGHELTHLVQGLSLWHRPSLHQRIPSGEAQCDVWTLARHELFCDDPPTYIKIPRMMREQWRDYATAVRCLCIAAIDKRAVTRTYLRWLEAEISALASTPNRQKPAPMQLSLPFMD